MPQRAVTADMDSQSASALSSVVIEAWPRTALFRCTGQRHTGQSCKGRGAPKIRPHDLLQVGGPVTPAFLWGNSCIWEIDQA